MSTKQTPPEVNPAHTIGRASVEAQDLAKFLATAEHGQVLTYQQLNAAAKVDVQAHPNVIQTARRMVMRDKGMVFGTIREIGVKLLTDEEIPDEGASCLKRSRRIAKKGIQILDKADPTKMSQEAKVRHFTTRTVLGLFQTSGSRKVLALAEQGVRVANGQMKIGDVSSLFGS